MGSNQSILNQLSTIDRISFLQLQIMYYMDFFFTKKVITENELLEILKPYYFQYKQEFQKLQKKKGEIFI